MLSRTRADERLARQAAAGDDRAFTVLYHRHHPALLRYCRSITGNEHDALDALQSAALKALLALRRGGCTGQVRPWLFRIAHNESVSLLRRRGSAAAVALQDDDVAVRDVADAVAEREALGTLVADLQALTVHQRSALVLRELSGLDYGEIAVALDTTPLAARQAVFAARSALHEQRAARDLTCVAVQRTLSDGSSRRGVRMHLRGCDDCRTFAREIRRRSGRLALLLPASPLSAAVVLQGVLGGAGAGAGAVGGAACATGGAVAGTSFTKAAAAALATVAAAGSVEQVVLERPREERRAQAAVAEQRAQVDADDRPAARAAEAATVLPAATAAASASARTTATGSAGEDAAAKDEPRTAARRAEKRDEGAAEDDAGGDVDAWREDAAADDAWADDGEERHGGGGRGGDHGGWTPPARSDRGGYGDGHPAQAARTRRPWREQAAAQAQPAAQAEQEPEPAAEPAPTTASATPATTTTAPAPTTTTTTAPEPAPAPAPTTTTPTTTTAPAPADPATPAG